MSVTQRRRQNDSISLDDDFVSPTTPQRNSVLVQQEDDVLTERTLQSWIEETLDIKIDERISQVSSLANLYTALESGEILCQLIHALFPDRIDMSLVHSFESEFANPSNYLSNAKDNVDLFIKSVESLGIPCYFSFENLYLQKNKSSILGCLSELRNKSITENLEEVDLTTPVKHKSVAFNAEVPSPQVVQQQQVEQAILPPQKTSSKQQQSTNKQQKQLFNTEVTNHSDSLAFGEGFLQGLIAIYSIPFVIVFVLISRLLLSK